ncbi:MAG TPA: hypothetical protein PLZ51_13715, partial [Aggregatilineales bacterium]|nr:hypothetical protein [Aggregatilineales bacterium]
MEKASHEFPSSIWLFVATDDDFMAQLPLSENQNIGFIGFKGTSGNFKIESSIDKFWVKNLITHLESLQIGIDIIPLPN